MIKLRWNLICKNDWEIFIIFDLFYKFGNNVLFNEYLVNLNNVLFIKVKLFLGYLI